MRATIMAVALLAATAFALPSWAGPAQALPHSTRASSPDIMQVWGGCGPYRHPVRRCGPWGCRVFCARNW